MGAIEAHVNASSKPTTLHKSTTGLLRPSGGCAKPPTYPARVIHTYSPRVYKIQPEEFLEVVQKLTGKSKPTTTKPKPRTFQFFETDASKKPENSNSRPSQQQQPDLDTLPSNESAGEVLDTPTTRNLLGALPSPRLVTLNFLPLLSATPIARTN